MNRRNFITSATALALTPWISSCQPIKPFRVGIHQWVGYQTLHLARDFNWLPSEVQLIEQNTATDSVKGLQDRTLDAACLTLDEALYVSASGVDISIILVFDVSAGADVVLSRSQISDSSGLLGKRIGVEKNAVGMLMLNALLQRFSLDEQDVQIIHSPPTEQVQQWRDGHLDLVISYEPTVSLLKREGAIPIMDSREVPNTIFDCLVVRTETLRPYYSVIKSLLKSHFAGVDHILQQRQDSIYRIAAQQSVKPEEIEQALAGIRFASTLSNHDYLNKDNGSLYHSATKVSRILQRLGLIEPLILNKEMFNDQFIPQ